MQPYPGSEIKKDNPKINMILFLIIGAMIGMAIISLIYFLGSGKDNDVVGLDFNEILQKGLEEQLSMNLTGDIDLDIYDIERSEDSVGLLATVKLPEDQLGRILGDGLGEGPEDYTILLKAEYNKQDGEWQLVRDINIYLGLDLNSIQKSMNQGMERANDARIKSDINQARINAELIWADNSSYENVCLQDSFNESDNDYGIQLKSLEEDIKERQGGVLTMHCQADNSNYCISTLLNTGDYFCVDSDGNVRDNADATTCSAASIACGRY